MMYRFAFSLCGLQSFRNSAEGIRPASFFTEQLIGQSLHSILGRAGVSINRQVLEQTNVLTRNIRLQYKNAINLTSKIKRVKITGLIVGCN